MSTVTYNRFTDMFSKFPEIKTGVWISLAAILVFGLLLILFRKRWTTRMLTYGAVCIALSFILSYIRIYRMPQGGSITPGSMLPLMLYSYVFGPAAGISAGAIYGLLQLFQDFYVVHPVSLLMDYVLAFAMLGLAGFSKKHLAPGVLLAGVGRWFWHFLSGFIFFGSYAWEGWNPVAYSAVYNGIVIGPDLLICFVIALIPAISHLADRLRDEIGALGKKKAKQTAEASGSSAQENDPE